MIVGEIMFKKSDKMFIKLQPSSVFTMKIMVEANVFITYIFDNRKKIVMNVSSPYFCYFHKPSCMHHRWGSFPARVCLQGLSLVQSPRTQEATSWLCDPPGASRTFNKNWSTALMKWIGFNDIVHIKELSMQRHLHELIKMVLTF